MRRSATKWVMGTILNTPDCHGFGRDVVQTLTLWKNERKMMNYTEWGLSIKTSLMLKNLEIGTPVTLDSKSFKEDKEKYKGSRQAFALLIKSLSPEVQASLPANM
ncbi:hypothetical protein D1P53_001892 [Cryptococcus gattii VGV]|nr:hypothetical protein D1P53_001892 [Cryptococcus gattii VGV]